MAELVTTGYAWLRDLMMASTVYLALFDESDVQIGARVAISGGEWSEDGQTLTITQEYAGTDFSLPQTIKSSRVYDSLTGGNAITALEAFSEGVATLRASADTLTVTHDIQVPQV